MPDIQHKDIPDPERHEPKGVSVATVGQSYVADGAGSGVWRKQVVADMGSGAETEGRYMTADGVGNVIWRSVARGQIYFVDVATPYTISTPTVYTKVDPATTASALSPVLFTEGTNARLTFTGVLTRHGILSASMSVSQTSGGTRVIQAAIYKNGAKINSSEQVVTTTSSAWSNISLIADTAIAPNDYFEVWALSSSGGGNMQVASMTMRALGM